MRTAPLRRSSCRVGGVFVILGCVGAALWLWSLVGLRETLEVERRNSAGLGGALRAFGALFRDPVFVAYAFSQGLVSAAMFAYISGSPFVLQDIYGISPQAFSACFAANGIGIVTAPQISGYLARRIEGRKIFRFGVILAALGGLGLLASVLLGLGLPGILPSLFVLVSCVGIVSTLGSSLAMQHHGKQAGSAAGLIGVSQLLLGAAATPLVGLGGSHDSLPMGAVIAVADVGALVWYALWSLVIARTEREVVS